MKTFLLISTSLLLLSCAATELSEKEKGYWVKNKNLKGTREAKRDHKTPYWQCVSNNLTNILDCNKK
tara:strand:+ start:1425 stop:1625 length:201 start_codon:yes stop_codon:yes gene_type:complete